MSALPKPHLTPEEYLDLEREAEFKSEYHEGEMLAMAGGNAPHSELAGAFIREVGMRIKGSGCGVFTSDMKISIENGRRFLYPDVSGVCGERKFRDEKHEVLLNPSLVVEVVSKSSEAYDRGRKMHLYMTLPSLVDYLLVAQDDVRVEQFSRQQDGVWHVSSHAGADALMRLESLRCEVALGDFYAGVELATADEIPPLSPAV